MYLTKPEELVPYHLTAKEVRCHVDGNPDAPCPHCGGAILLSQATAVRFLKIRTKYGKPITVNSGYRCKAKQQVLYDKATPEERAKGLVAKPGTSPHETGDALDLACPEGMGPMSFARLALDACAGDVRIGAKEYKSFIHIDTKGSQRGIRW